MTEHLQQMRFTAAEEAAHPGCFLMGLVATSEERREDVYDALCILTLTNECGELAAQLLPNVLVCTLVGDTSLSIVDQALLRRIAE
jgi:hypothetical protein